MGITYCNSSCLKKMELDFDLINRTSSGNPLKYRRNKKETKKNFFFSYKQIEKNKNKFNYIFCENAIIDKNMLIGLASGDINENYKKIRKIADGNFAAVYLVNHNTIGEKRAMKIMKKKTSFDLIHNVQSDDKDILNEIEILKKIDHPNIVKIFEFYNSTRNYYLVTEYCEDGELFDKIIKEAPFSEEYTAYIMYQIFSAVAYCHKLDILHRDLKPENILVECKEKKGLKVKLIDFGTAKIMDKNKNEKKIIGSSYYIAPEVLLKSYNEKCDLWSCGVILYILLSSSPPFRGNHDQDIINSIKKSEYDLESPIWLEISEDAKDLIKNLLEKDVDKRISANEAMEHRWFKKLKIKEHFNYLETDTIKKMLNQLSNYPADKILQHIALAFLVHNFPQHNEVINANKLFNMIDVNSNGKINEYELKIGIKNLLKNENMNFEEITENIFYNLDWDRNGFIDYGQFIRGCIDKENFLTDDIIKFSFDFFDKDKNGEITCIDIEMILLRKYFNEVESYNEYVKKVISEVDINKDGKITFDEFKIMMRNLSI